MLSETMENMKDILKLERISGETKINCYFASATESYNTLITCERKKDILDLIFCLDGVLTLNKGNEKSVTLIKNELLILSDCMEEDSLNFSKSFKAIIVRIDYPKYIEDKAILENVPYENSIKGIVEKNQGCNILRENLWVQSMFENLEKMNTEDKCAYIRFKIMELFYLISKSDILPLEKNTSECKDKALEKLMENMKEYMEKHLDEKLTIEYMCNKFNISPTLFKATFKNRYGEPVHSWIQKQRMHMAAKYLCTSSMNVLQIAYEVGFGGTSQFNSLFKRYYGVTPTQYRKLSYTGRISPIQ